MSEIAIRAAGPEDEAAVCAVVLLAFAADPFARWVFPDPATFLAASPDFTMAFGGNGLAHGCLDIAGDGLGVAMWLPPEVAPDSERMDAILAAHAPAAILPDLGALVERLAAAHPAEPHWYLPVIGVDPCRHGEGIGSALLRHGLARCDAAGIAAYLESSHPRNVALYARHGFEARPPIEAGSAPPLVPMLRRPR